MSSMMRFCGLIPTFRISSRRHGQNRSMRNLFPFLLSHATLLMMSGISRRTMIVSADECPSSSDNIMTKHKFYINGTWTDPHETDEAQNKICQNKHHVVDPSTGRPFASIILGSQLDVDIAVSSAKNSFFSWSVETSLEQRLSYIERLLDIYNDRSEEMAKVISMEMGAPIDMSRDEQTGMGSEHIKTFLEILKHGDFHFDRTLLGGRRTLEDESPTLIRMDPVGVVAMITPWNWPMYQIVLKVIPALAVGCTAVLKPSEIAPLSAHLFTEFIHDAGFPPGVFNLVHGDGGGVGTYLTSHPKVDMVSFTGSTRAGASVSKSAADTFKKVSLELGGKGANIIFADVVEEFALEEVVAEGVYGCFENSGQSCNAPTRMLVERSIYDDVIRIAKSVVEGVEVKSAHESGDHLGPVVSHAQFEKIQSYIKNGIDEGAQLVAGGLGRPDGCCPTKEEEGGFYVRPSVFADCHNNMKIMREEIFGPVLCIAPFESEEEALEIANDTPYGLANYVQSSNKDRRRRMALRLRSGLVHLNGIMDFTAPFGGMKASGNGREVGVWGLEEFCEPKSVTGW